MMRWPPAVCGLLVLCAGGAVASSQAAKPQPMRAHQQTPSGAPQAPGTSAPVESAQALVARTCVGCHNDRARSGNLSLESFDLATAGQHADTTEKMIRKLRAGQMPPPGTRRPDEAALANLAERAGGAGGRARAGARRQGGGAFSVSTARSTRDRSTICSRSR